MFNFISVWCSYVNQKIYKIDMSYMGFFSPPHAMVWTKFEHVERDFFLPRQILSSSILSQSVIGLI